MTPNEKPTGAANVGGLQDDPVSPPEYAETREAQNVLILAAGAIGILPTDLQRMNPAGAQSLALRRLREIEGQAELLGRQTDALEAFLQALGRSSRGAA